MQQGYADTLTQGAESRAARLNNYSVMRMTLKGASFAIYMEDFKIEKVIGFDALFESMLKCKRGVMWKDSTAGYVLNGIVRTMNLEKQLHEGTYRAGKTVKFQDNITEATRNSKHHIQGQGVSAEP